MKKELIVISSVPAKFTADFEKAEAYLKSELEKYDVVVTLDTLAGSKELATELNKTAGSIDKKRREAVAEASEPIKSFDAKMKSLVDMCKEGRLKILDQVKVFEDETRKQVEILLVDYRAELWRELKVKEEFISAEFDDLIILTNMTKAGSLAGKAKAELEKRVNADKQNQDRVEKRLLLLENASYKAGLLAPLTRVHVNSFLFADDDTYNTHLDEIIESEKQRQAVAEEAVRKRVLKENKQDKDHPLTEPALPSSSGIDAQHAAQGTAYVKPAAPVGQTMHVIRATFEVSVPDNIHVDRVVNKLKTVMEKAGITTLSKIEVVA